MHRAKKLLIALAILICVSAGPAAARGLCEGELQTRSLSGTAPTTITYTNTGTTDDLWVWLDRQGNRQLFRTLKPGEAVHQATFVGHYWIVTNKGEDCEIMIRAEPDDVFKVIYEDTAATKKDFAKRLGLPDDFQSSWARSPASCEQAADRLAVTASGYTLGRSACSFVEGPIDMEGGFQATSDCGGQKHAIRMTMASGLLTMQGAGASLDNLARCPSGSAASSDYARQQCVKAVNDDSVHPYTQSLRKEFVTAFGDANAPPTADDLKTGVYRCMNAHLVACLVGANLPCFKMDTSKRNAGAETFCHDNANNDSVPLVASGHGSVYEYKCVGPHAEIKDTMYELDSRGFARDLWKVLN